MPQKRAISGAVKDGERIGGQFVHGQIADATESEFSTELGLVDTIIDTGDTDASDWEKVSASIGGRKVTWTKNDDGTVTSQHEGGVTFLMIERFHDEQYWKGSKKGSWADKANRHDVALWSSEIIRDLLEEGHIDPFINSVNPREVAGLQNCLTSCYTANSLPENRVGRHKLSSAMARTKAAKFLHQMGVFEKGAKLGGCRLAGHTKTIKRGVSSVSMDFAEGNLRECYEAYNVDKHRTFAYNGDGNDLIWKLLAEEVPTSRNHNPHKNEQSALYCALEQGTSALNLGTGRNRIRTSTMDVASLIADGCVESDEIAEKVLDWLGVNEPDTEATEEPVYNYSRNVFTSELIGKLRSSEILGLGNKHSHDTTPPIERDNYYEGNRLRRLIQITAVGYNKSVARQTVVPNRYKTLRKTTDHSADAYYNAEIIADFRNYLRRQFRDSAIWEETQKNGWDKDPYTVEAIATHQERIQSIYDQTPRELHQYISDAHQMTWPEILEQKHKTRVENHSAVPHPNQLPS